MGKGASARSEAEVQERQSSKGHWHATLRWNGTMKLVVGESLQLISTPTISQSMLYNELWGGPSKLCQELKSCDWQQMTLARALLVSIGRRTRLWTGVHASASYSVALTSQFATSASHTRLKYSKPWTASAFEVEIRSNDDL